MPKQLSALLAVAVVAAGCSSAPKPELLAAPTPHAYEPQQGTPQPTEAQAQTERDVPSCSGALWLWHASTTGCRLDGFKP